MAIAMHCKILSLITAVQIMMCTYAGEIIFRSFLDFNDKLLVNWRKLKPQNLDDLNDLQLLLSMKDGMGFSGWNLYQVRGTTVLAIFASVITYSVILIQTDS